VPKSATHVTRTNETREQVLKALLHADRAQYDELGRTRSSEHTVEDPDSHSSPREQGAAPIDLENVDE
jgi:hypothetical protein